MKYSLFIIIICSFLLLVSCHSKLKTDENLNKIPKTELKIIPGINNLIDNYLSLIENKRVGLVTNPSGANSDLINSSDFLFNHPDINLVALYGPEHGVRGNIYGGKKIADEVDQKTGIPLYSLYGKTRKPTEKMLDGIDIVLFDIQDIGLRAYTYIYTMAKVMEACAEFKKPFIVLDRPNPLGGLKVEGNITEKEFLSFIGLFPIPYRHGMTIGELALLFNKEFNINCDLTVVPMIGWERDMYWNDTGLEWIPTSPHVPHWSTIPYLGATGTFGELHVLSEGVGYTSPFEIVGAPWINAEEFAISLNSLNLAGVKFRPIHFKPYYMYYSGQMCQGVQLHITDLDKFNVFITGLYIMQTTMRLYPGNDLFAKPKRVNMFNKAVGTDKIFTKLKANIPVSEIQHSWKTELQEFIKVRKKYLLY